MVRTRKEPERENEICDRTVLGTVRYDKVPESQERRALADTDFQPARHAPSVAFLTALKNRWNATP